MRLPVTPRVPATLSPEKICWIGLGISCAALSDGTPPSAVPPLQGCSFGKSGSFDVTKTLSGRVAMPGQCKAPPGWRPGGACFGWGRRALTWQASARGDRSSIGNRSPCGELSWGAVPCHFGTRIIEAPRPQPPQAGAVSFGDGHSWNRLRVRWGVCPSRKVHPA